MKIIHCADLHLGSPLSSISSKEARDARKNDILRTFDRLIDYAKDNNIDTILLSGDVFDNDRPTKKDKTYFYSAIKTNPEIKFYYLRGNHDIEESLEEQYDNLLRFDESWQYYKIDNLVIAGIELSDNNKKALYSSLKLDPNDINIVMMHGDINSKGKEFIDLKQLANKNIDYLALGHIHTYSEAKIDKRGTAIYPGCIDGRGFDETGEKGFVVLTIENNQITYEFVKFYSRLVIEREIDISAAESLYNAKEIVKDGVKNISKDSLVKIILTGKVNFDTSDIDKDIQSLISDSFFVLRVESKVRRIILMDDYTNDLSLRGEFIRSMFARDDLSEEEKEEIINTGLKLLNGEDVE